MVWSCGYNLRGLSGWLYIPAKNSWGVNERPAEIILSTSQGVRTKAAPLASFQMCDNITQPSHGFLCNLLWCTTVRDTDILVSASIESTSNSRRRMGIVLPKLILEFVTRWPWRRGTRSKRIGVWCIRNSLNTKRICAIQSIIRSNETLRKCPVSKSLTRGNFPCDDSNFQYLKSSEKVKVSYLPSGMVPIRTPQLTLTRIFLDSDSISEVPYILALRTGQS